MFVHSKRIRCCICSFVINGMGCVRTRIMIGVVGVINLMESKGIIVDDLKKIERDALLALSKNSSPKQSEAGDVWRSINFKLAQKRAEKIRKKGTLTFWKTEVAPHKEPLMLVTDESALFPIGGISLRRATVNGVRTTQIQLSALDTDFQGKGIGKLMYEVAADTFPYLSSDYSVSRHAIPMWKHLWDKGYKIRVLVNSYTLEEIMPEVYEADYEVVSERKDYVLPIHSWKMGSYLEPLVEIKGKAVSIFSGRMVDAYLICEPK